MKRTYKYALTVVLGLGVVAPAFGQSGFPDVKDTHWAADSVNRLKLEGLIHGDSDGNFNGNRTMTRYEVATIVYEVYKKLVGFNEGVEKDLKALEAKINSISVPSGQTVDISDIKSAISDLNSQVGTMKAWGSDLAQLKKMTSAYGNELRTLGADVDQMKKNISDVSARVSKLEGAKNGIMISGDASFWMGAASAASGSTIVLNQDGKYLQNNPTGAGFDNLLVTHELGLTIQDPNANVPFKAVIVATNTLDDGNGNGFGRQAYSANALGSALNTAGESVYLAEATAKFNNYNLLVGRQNMMLNKFILQRPDTTSFYNNERWDNHAWTMDGGTFGFGGNGNGKLFFGTLNDVVSSAGVNVQPLQLNTLGVQRIWGATYAIPFAGDKGTVAASYVNYDGALGINVNFSQSNDGSPQGIVNNGITRQAVYGADLNYDMGSFQIEAGAGKSVGYGIAAPVNNGAIARPALDTLVDKSNGRWDVSVGTKSDSYAFKVGYKNIEQNYIAPGDWGRVSIFRNLTDTKSVTAYGMVKLSKALDAHAWYEKGDGITGPGDYKSWKAGFGYMLTQKWDADATYEDTKFDNGFQGIVNGAESKFTTLKLGYDTGMRSKINIFWQNSDLQNILPRLTGGAQKGSFYGMQYSVKF